MRRHVFYANGRSAGRTTRVADRVTAELITSPLVSRPSRGSFDARRAQARQIAVAAALIALGATSAGQVLGFSLTMLTPICLLLAPARLLMRPTVGQWLLLSLAVIGFIAFLVSSQINGLSLTDQRVLQWLSFAVYFMGFLVLAGRDVERACSLLCGVAIGTVVYYTLPGNAFAGLYQFADLWKYAWGQWIVIIVIYLLAALKLSVELQAVFLVLLAGFSLVENYRSLATNCVIAALIIILGWLFAGKIARWLQLMIVVGLGAGLYTLVPKIALSGLVGDAIRRKTEFQANTGVPLILAGRTESPLSISAIQDRPWFGWGSANNISAEVFDRAKTLAIDLGFDPTYPIEGTWYLENGDVSLHSVLLAAWAEGGLFSALLPLGLFCAALAIIWNAGRYGRWAALAVVVSVQAIWDLVFSPYSYNFIPGLALLAVLFAARHLPPMADSAARTEAS